MKKIFFSCEPGMVANLLTLVFIFYSGTSLQGAGLPRSECKQFSTSSGVTSLGAAKCKSKLNPDKIEAEAVLVGYVSANGYVNGIAVLSGNKFSAASENSAALIPRFYQIDGAGAWDSACEFNLEILGKDRCVWSAHISKAIVKEWVLVSNIPNISSLKSEESKKAREWFKKNKGKCQEMGEMTNCVTPEFLAISDLNKNGFPEIWHQEVYSWELGGAMTEIDLTKGKIISSFSVCHGCDD